MATAAAELLLQLLDDAGAGRLPQAALIYPGVCDAVEMVAKDCSDSVSAMQFPAGLTNSLLLRKKSTAVIANWKSASRKRRPWKDCNCDLEY
jgi:hypothetical protein